MIMLGNEQVLSKFKLNDFLSVKDFLDCFGRELTRCYYPSAQIYSEENKDLWKNPELGLKTVLTSDGLFLVLVYPARDRKTGEAGYATVALAKVEQKTGYVRLLDSIRKHETFLQGYSLEPLREGLELVFERLAGLGPNPEIIENDLEDEIMDCLESGDLDALEDLVGDRDLAEFI